MNSIPNHVALIVDGNRRWAKKHKLTSFFGHKNGFEQLESIIEYAVDQGVRYISCYVFSTENFKREKAEVDYLMRLFCDNFPRLSLKLRRENIKAVFSGRKTNLQPEVIDCMDGLEEATADCTRATVNFCLNYGGQAEIIDACKEICEDVKKGIIQTEDIDNTLFEGYLYQKLPPVDLLIRTSGEIRISNFMLWQLAYAEMYFTDVLFPDFSEDEFDKALAFYNKRERRFGGNSVK